jgi:transcription-repair coupling factor (superfamily II helicase)
MNMKAVETLQSAWNDRFGRLPHAVSNLLEITRIKILASSHGINSVEIQGQRLMLERNGGYILVGERRFPRLEADKPVCRLAETLALLRTM